MSQQISILVIQLGVILLLAKVFGSIAAKLHIPSVMGELLAGLLFGPYCLGSIALPGLADGLFPLCTDVIGIPVDAKLYAVASLGSIILLFISGLETDVHTFFKYSIAGGLVGLGGIVFSFLCGAAVGTFILGWAFMDPRTLFLGILCTATSVGISARILSEHRAMDSPEGVTIMAAAVIDDVLGIVCLAIVLGIAAVELNGGSMAWANILGITLRSFGIWLGVTAVGLAFARRIAKFLNLFGNVRSFAALAFGLALILAGLFEQAGLAMIIGAFVMGLSLSKTDIAFSLRSTLTPVYNFLVPIFFVVMGMLADVRVLKDPQVLKIGLIFTVMAIIGKVVGCFVPAFLLNFNATGALRIGVGMVPRCEVVLIIAGIAATTMMKNPKLKEQESGKIGSIASVEIEHKETIQEQVPIFDGRLFGIAIIMPLITALIAPPLLNMALAIKKKGTRRDVPDADSTITAFNFGSEAITITVLHKMLELLHDEGFKYSSFSKGIRVIQFRRDKTSFSLEIVGTTFHFSSAPEDITLIKTVVYESIVEIHRNLSDLKQLAQPDAYKSEIHSDTRYDQANVKRIFSLDKLVTPRHILVNLQAKTKTEALEELISAIKAYSPQLDEEKALQDLLLREEIVSTYQDNGIAMPHTRTEATNTFVTAIGVIPTGFDYDPGEPHTTQIVVLSLCPKDEPGPYLQFIAQIAQILSNDTLRNKLLTAKTPEDACKIFVKA